MAGRLLGEIKQRVPWDSLEEEALLNLVRTTDALGQEAAALLRLHGITRAQYNVLRILRGAGESGLGCAEIGERLIAKDPDVTRLLDRLVKRKLIRRVRDREDRRVVRSRITEAGLELLARLDQPVRDLNRGLLGHLGERALRDLITLLERARTRPG